MIARYTTPEAERILGPTAKLRSWWAVEEQVLYAAFGQQVFPLPAEFPHLPRLWQVLRSARAEAEGFGRDIADYELVTHHDVAAFVMAMRDRLPESVGPYLHLGMTSSDLVDTAEGLRYRQVYDLARVQVMQIRSRLQDMSDLYQGARVMARTHGRWAEPIDLSLVLTRFGFLLESVLDHPVGFYGKVSGATGQYLTLPESVEESVLTDLRLDRHPATTQVVPRIAYNELWFRLSQLVAVCEQIATWVRLSSIEGVDEVLEIQPFNSVGSTAMPHKAVNPIRSEQICGLARVARADLSALLGSSVTWWEQSIDHSSVERTAGDDLLYLTHYLLDATLELLNRVAVRTDRMGVNVERYLLRHPEGSTAVSLYRRVLEGADLETTRQELAVDGPAKPMVG